MMLLVPALRLVHARSGTGVEKAERGVVIEADGSFQHDNAVHDKDVDLRIVRKQVAAPAFTASGGTSLPGVGPRTNASLAHRTQGSKAPSESESTLSDPQSQLPRPPQFDDASLPAHLLSHVSVMLAAVASKISMTPTALPKTSSVREDDSLTPPNDYVIALISAVVSFVLLLPAAWDFRKIQQISTLAEKNASATAAIVRLRPDSLLASEVDSIRASRTGHVCKASAR